jgi:thiamine-phosphate pyrophosphorylase
MIRDLRVPVIALGGMGERRWRALRRLGVHGWAGIDAWSG